MKINNQQRYRQMKGFTVFFGLLVGALTLVSVVSPTPVNASSNATDTLAISDNDFYAFVEAGENLDVTFTKAAGIPSGVDNTVLTLSRPGAVDETCSIPAAALNGASCAFTDETATVDGIWKISLQPNAGHNFTWTINVQSGITDIPGRVWTEQYTLVQIATLVGIDSTLWYQDKTGYLYEATYRDYNGLISLMGASSLGLVESGGGCNPLYKSVNVNDTDYEIAPDNCQSYFKLFFEPPATDLPSSSLKWDGDSEWVKPAITPPAITGLGFTPSVPNARDGSLTFDVGDYTGVLSIDVDTDDNGSYTDPDDVSLQGTAIASAVSIPFDGNDGSGDAIPTSQTINFRVSIDRQAEIHFLNQDVERRSGGLEVELLNGPNAGDNTLFWDDTRFANPDVNRCSLTTTSDATSGVVSAGGVHGWTNDGCPAFGSANDGISGSWGDYRIINDWTYATTNESETYTLAGQGTTPPVTPPTTPPVTPIDGSDGTPSAPDTGFAPSKSSFMTAILIALAVVVAGAIGLRLKRMR